MTLTTLNLLRIKETNMGVFKQIGLSEDFGTFYVGNPYEMPYDEEAELSRIEEIENGTYDFIFDGNGSNIMELINEEAVDYGMVCTLLRSMALAQYIITNGKKEQRDRAQDDLRVFSLSLSQTLFAGVERTVTRQLGYV